MPTGFLKTFVFPLSAFFTNLNLDNTLSTRTFQALPREDDLNDVIREESSRGKKRPVNADAIKEQADRRDAVLRIFRRGAREDLQALLKTWGYSEEKIEAILKEYDAALE
jgi:hypothetical protein